MPSQIYTQPVTPWPPATESHWQSSYSSSLLSHLITKIKNTHWQSKLSSLVTVTSLVTGHHTPWGFLKNYSCAKMCQTWTSLLIVIIAALFLAEHFCSWQALHKYVDVTNNLTPLTPKRYLQTTNKVQSALPWDWCEGSKQNERETEKHEQSRNRKTSRVLK